MIQEHEKSWNYELTQRQLRKIVNVDLRPTEKRKLFLQFFDSLLKEPVDE